MRRVLLLALVAATPTTLVAQGTLSTQGLGWPQGQLSTRALTAGGALGETDPASALNPAALIGFGTTALYFQVEPEYRSLRVNGTSERTSTSRFPLLAAAIPIGQRFVAGFAASTLLDRTWATRNTTTDTLESDTVSSTTEYRLQGSIADVRLALAYEATRNLRFGAGLHLLSGSNQVTVLRTFDDTVNYAAFRENNVLSYGGTAFSAGAHLVVPRRLSLGLTARRGGTIEATTRDSVEHVQGTGRAPDRFGLTVAFIGIANTTLAGRYAVEKWSSLGPLVAAPGSAPVDATDFGLGADVAGPTLGSYALMLRGGGRWRTLPFAAAGKEVRESAFSLGMGTTVARGRAVIDLGILRASRSAGIAGTRESAWTLSLGATVRP